MTVCPKFIGYYVTSSWRTHMLLPLTMFWDGHAPCHAHARVSSITLTQNKIPTHQVPRLYVVLQSSNLYYQYQIALVVTWKTSCARGDTICPRPPPASWQYLRIYSLGGTCSGMLAIWDISKL